MSELHRLTYHSYQVASTITSAAATLTLAEAIKDTTRLDTPTNFNALVLCAIADSPAELANQLKSINSACEIPAFITAQNYARSLVKLKQDQFAELNGQSIEWTASSITALPLLAQKQINDELEQVREQGESLISTIDDALTDAQTLKSDRDKRLHATPLSSVAITKHSINAATANALANELVKIGNNSEHWAFAVFVGEQSMINKINEVI